MPGTGHDDVTGSICRGNCHTRSGDSACDQSTRGNTESSYGAE